MPSARSSDPPHRDEIHGDVDDSIDEIAEKGKDKTDFDGPSPLANDNDANGDSMPALENTEEFIQARIGYVGFIDQMGLEGVVILKTIDGKEFPMRAFSGEVAKHISRFQEGDKGSIPTIYNLVEEIAVLQDLLLYEIRVYQSGSVLRANLYFKSRNKKDLVLRGYRASDSIALASYYDIPIKVRKNLFEEALEKN